MSIHIIFTINAIKMMRLLLLLSLQGFVVVGRRSRLWSLSPSPSPSRKFVNKNEPDKIFSGYSSFPKAENASEKGGLIVNCGEKSWRIVVKSEFFEQGLSLSPSPRLVQLGEHDGVPAKQCSPQPDFLTDSHMVIVAGLQDCGSESRVSGDWLIYTNKLVFSTGPLLTLDGVLIVKRTQTVVPIECHYKRRFRVSAEPLSPTWLPMTSTVEAAGLLQFSLHIIKEGPIFTAQPTILQQGEPLLLEAAVHAPMHHPLRIYVDHCEVTADSDPLLKRSYEFISNHGCLVDSALPNSPSKFYSRTKRNVLRFIIHGFIFPKDHRKQVFISCHLRATPHHSSSDSQNKACYFHWPSNSWHSAEGNNTVCSCCETGDCTAGKTDMPSKYMEVDVGPLHILPTKPLWTGKLVIGDRRLT